MNGKHLVDYRLKAGPGFLSLEAKTSEKNVPVAVREGHLVCGKSPSESKVVKHDESITREMTFELQAGESLELQKMMVVYTGNDEPDPSAAARKSLVRALDMGYDRLKEEHAACWDKIWNRVDIEIDNDLLSQAILRFNLYHNIIATPFHSDHLPIGARGLSCQAYQGSAFWDQEIFNLPMYYYTMPEVARNILVYRYKTLDGARRKAKRLGYRGAFYAWVSGISGDELCPSFFFTDVLTGRKIRNHFNDWQIHISPDIVYAAWTYYRVTGDWDFIEKYGAEIIFEVARFLYSHGCLKKDRGVYVIKRVLGPDEYHENVDNNAYTNYLARFSLDRAIYLYDYLKQSNPGLWEELTGRLDITEKEIGRWKEMFELLVLPEPDPRTGVIEQFEGYYELEDVLPGKLEKRLLDKSEYWGWPNGVAVHTRVSKQADVLQLLVLDDDLFPREVLRQNYDYYEPRCQHGSSLSPSVHSLAAAKAGYVEEAYRYFLRSSLVDLLDTNKTLSGGTFIGGIHTACCGAAWQMVVFGFAGLKSAGKGFVLNPRLPAGWNGLKFKLLYRGQELLISVDEEACTVSASPGNDHSVEVYLQKQEACLEPGASARLALPFPDEA